jgi:hypothetical protein
MHTSKEKRGTAQDSVVIGCFIESENARRAIRTLHDVGFSDDHIGVVTRDDEGEVHITTVDEAKGSKAGEGAAIGLAAGAGGGALWALGIAAGVLPAIGPVLAGGLLTAVIASAASGAAAGGIVGALIGLGIPDEDAKYYEEELKKGRTIVVVDAQARMAEAIQILRGCGSYNRYEPMEPIAQPQSQRPYGTPAQPH